MLCADADLIRWEPMLAAECGDVSQSLYEGRAAFDRATRALAPLGAVGLARVGAIAVVDGACAIVEQIDDAPLPSTAVVSTLAVRTFAAQRRVVADQLARIALPGAPADALRRAAALGALHLIYAATFAAAAPGAEADAAVRAELYLRLYRQSLRGIARGFDAIDEDDDGETRPRGRPRSPLGSR